MKMAEGQRKVDGQREQRKPRSLPDMVPKPAHAACYRFVSERSCSKSHPHRTLRAIVPEGLAASIRCRQGNSVICVITTPRERGMVASDHPFACYAHIIGALT
jgi:hypothetical protein